MSNSNYFSKHAHKKYKTYNTKKIATGLAAVVAVGILSLGLLRPEAAHATVPGTNELISVDSSGNLANQFSSAGASISGDGKIVAFESAATNLVSGDTNASDDIFVRDRNSGTTTRISVSSAGTQANGDSYEPQISYDGRYVIYASSASNLVSGDTNGNDDIFRYDSQTGSTVLVSSSSSGTISNSVSSYPDISADGRFVAFNSFGSNLVSGISPGGVGVQVFLKDVTTGAIKALSVNSSGSQGNADSSIPRISCDGGVVSFYSSATNLVPSDTNGKDDIFVDSIGWNSNELSRVTNSTLYDSDKADTSCNGNYIAYHSGNDVYAYNRLTGASTQASLDSAGNDASGDYPSISDDGRYVAFESYDLLDSYSGNGASTTNIYVRDIKGQTTQSVSRNSTYLSGHSAVSSISADGSYVSYQNADGLSPYRLLPGDTNGYADIYTSETGF